MKQAIFSGLILDQAGQAIDTAYVGDTPCYVIVEAGFRRHVEAEKIDRQVLTMLAEQVAEHRELVTASMLTMLGKDDLFTKAMIDASLQNTDKNIALLMEQGLPEETRTWLGVLGFRIIVNIHGDVVRIDSPGIVEE
ncbi:MAG: hypothetical protein JW850_01735 [Thermoflexales bacterium]|nr:hypothetical protein [Thermoflexales bacterium]